MAIGPTEFYNEINRQCLLEGIVKEKVEEMDKRLRKLAVGDKAKGSFVVVCLPGILSKELRELISQAYVDEDYAKGKSELRDYLVVEKED